jgi:hypothetical protein
MVEQNKDEVFNLIACLRAASTAQGPARDPLFESALSDPAIVFEAKFERAVAANMGFSLTIRPK